MAVAPNNICDDLSATSKDLSYWCREAMSRCGRIANPQQRAVCDETVVQCAREAKKGVESITIARPNGLPPLISSPRGCFAVSRSLAEISRDATGGHRDEFVAPPAERIREINRPNTVPQRIAGSVWIGSPVQRVETAPHSACRRAGLNTMGVDLCLDIVDACLSRPEGPYIFPGSQSSVTFATQASCIQGAPAYAQSRDRIAHPRPPADGEPPPRHVTAEQNQNSTDSTNPTRETRPPSLVIPFGTLNFYPEIERDNQSSTFRVVVETMGYTKALKLTYTAKRGPGERISLKYRFHLESGEPLGKEKSIEFEAPDGEISDDLKFAVWLSGQGASAKIISAEIIR